LIGWLTGLAGEGEMVRFAGSAVGGSSRSGLGGNVCRRALVSRVGTPSFPGAPLTEPDLWASHPALRDAGVRGTQSP
jgi:hypothetical protein